MHVQPAEAPGNAMIQAIQAFVDGTEPDEVADTCDKTSERDPKEEKIPVRFACMYPPSPSFYLATT